MKYKDAYKKIDELLVQMPDYMKDFVQAREDQDQSPTLLWNI
ncbi:site-specific tyrosine recombinase XerS (plasmid) [Enterococcus mundtii]|uniref:Site-specific tyrosine recombinase XerS n=1 Tax=Enterococcus mundtii TaxID=53346 RepID=A0AAI8RCV9_ENTMU|nr:site-specific tyrosine recombinase XerS [Enterococcus mundtii]